MSPWLSPPKTSYSKCCSHHLINQLREQIILTWEDFPRPVDLVFEQHEAIVSAVGKGDAEAARQAMTKHLIFSREVLEDISKSHQDNNP